MQKTKYGNNWLLEREFIHQITFDNKMYLTQLFQRVFDLLKEFPIPIATSYDFKGQKIYFMFLENKKAFLIDGDIDIEDYVTLVKRWAKPFLPTYLISTTETVPLEPGEIFKRIKKDKIPVDEAVDLTKEVEVIERGDIPSVYLSEDWFKMYINGVPSIRKSNGLIRKGFLHLLKDITDDNERKVFIMGNSTEIIDKEDLETVYAKAVYFQEYPFKTIKFIGQKMVNFFSINYPDLKKESIDNIKDLTYTWGRFTIVFADEETETICLEYVWRKRDADGVNFNAKEN